MGQALSRACIKPTLLRLWLFFFLNAEMQINVGENSAQTSEVSSEHVPMVSD